MALSWSTAWLLAQHTPASGRKILSDGIVVARGLDGVTLESSPTVEPLRTAAPAPLALASADFDEDGVADLVAGLEVDGLALVALYRGNGDVLHDHDNGAPPFFGGVTFEVPVAPEFVATGDFDADGHWDIAAASARANTLAWLRGNGDGAFDAARTMALPAAVTGMAAGELNRDDGLVDLAVSVSDESGSRILLFAGPAGLLSRPAEIILPGRIAQLAIAHLDDDWFGDLAVLADDELLIYHGHDAGQELDAAAPAPTAVSRHALGFSAAALAVGQFDPRDAGSLGMALLDRAGGLHTLTRRHGSRAEWNRATLGHSSDEAAAWRESDGSGQPALASARLSGSAAEDLIVVNRGSRRVSIVSPAGTAAGRGGATTGLPAILDLAATPMAVLPMRVNGDASSDLVIFQDGAAAPSVVMTTAARTFVVNDPGDEGDCDITDNVCSIDPVDPITGKCTGGCTFRAALEEANVASDLDTIEFALGSGTPTIVKQGGADWTATSPVTINGNTGGATRVHLDANGHGNTLVVRGGSSTIRNLIINGGAPGITVSTNGGNFFEGNWIGLDASGAVAKGNPGAGMVVTTPLNTIGGTTAAARNVISASGQNGLEIRNATGNTVLGNFIGTDATGNVDLGNKLSGLYLELAGNTTIGGTVAGARNVISGNDGALGAGVFANISPNLTLQGNYIGTTVAGNAALGNSGPGVRLVSGSNDVVGGTTAGARNVISANGSDGVIIRSINVSAKALVQGNSIGAAANGTLLGNAGFGIAIHGTHDNTIGGTTTGTPNVIAGNASAGVALQFAGAHPMGNAIRGNSILLNGGLGIDLGADNVTANDACDPDSGANARQNAPVVTSVSGVTTVQGTLNSKASTTFKLDFYSSPAGDISGYGEGELYLGSKNVTTNASCTVSFTATFAKPVQIDHVVTATATDPANNTSEFSAGVLTPGAIAVTSPNTAVSWGIGSIQRIQWSHNLGAGAQVKIEMSRDGGTNYSVLAASVQSGATTGTYNWTVAGPPTAQARIRVTSLSRPSVADVSNVNFVIADPFVTVNRPTLSSHVWTIGTKQTLQWTSNIGALEKVRVELSKDGGATYPIVLLLATPSDGMQAVTVPAAWATATARVRIAWVKNAAVSDTSDQNFAVQ